MKQSVTFNGYLKVFLLFTVLIIGNFKSRSQTFTDEQGLLYQILTEPEGGEYGTCAVGNNTQYSGSEVTFPATVENNGKVYKLVKINEGAFKNFNYDKITKFDFSKSTNLETIEKEAFYCQIRQTKNGKYYIDFSHCDNLKTIGAYAFGNFDAYPNFTGLPALEEIGPYAFNNCYTYKLDLSNKPNLKIIGDYAFCNNYIKEIKLSGCTSLETIGAYVFDNGSTIQNTQNEFIESIDLSGCTALKTIGRNFCNNAVYLKSVDFSNCISLETIGICAFSGTPLLSNNTYVIKEFNFTNCRSLKAVDYYWFYSKSYGYRGHQYVKFISFEGCESLTELDLGYYSAIEEIPDKFFEGCKSLTNVKLHYRTKSIGTSAFEGCESLTSIQANYYSNSVEYKRSFSYLQTIGDRAFAGCKSLQAFSINDENIASGYFTTLGKNVFEGCESLKTINFRKCTALAGRIDLTGAGLEEIPEYAFEECKKIEYIILPSSIKTIKAYAFKKCDALRTITVPEESQLETIESYAFEEFQSNYPFVLNNLPKLSKIESMAFGGFRYIEFKNCPQLKTILPLAFNSPRLTLINFENCESLVSFDSSMIGEITDNEGITRFSFTGCTGLKSVDLSNINIQITLNPETFKGCTSLTHVVLAPLTANNTEKNRLFQGCTSLKYVDLSNMHSGLYANYDLFKDCSSLETVIFSKNTYEIGNNAFDGCGALKNIVFLYEGKGSFNVGTTLGDGLSDDFIIWTPNPSLVSKFKDNEVLNKFIDKVLPFGAVKSLSIESDGSESLTFPGSTQLKAIFSPEKVAINSDGIEFKVPDLIWEIEEGEEIASISGEESDRRELSVNRQGDVKVTVSVPIDGEPDFTKTAEFISTVTPEKPVTSIFLDHESISMVYNYPGVKLSASIKPEDASFGELEWSIEQENEIIEIEKNPDNSHEVIIKPQNAGTAKIKAVTLDGTSIEASCEVKIIDHPHSLDVAGNTIKVEEVNNRALATQDSPILYGTDIIMRKGQTAQLCIKSNEEIDYVVTPKWEIDNADHAKITDEGFSVSIEALEIAETIYRATLPGEETPLVEGKLIIIAENPAYSLNLSPDEVSVPLNTEVSLTAEIAPQDVTIKQLQWDTSDDKVATVDPTTGEITLKGEGEVIITAKTTDGTQLTSSSKIIVTPKILKSFTLSHSQLKINAGDNAKVSVVNYTPEDAPTPTFNWEIIVGEEGIALEVSEDSREINIKAIIPGEYIVEVTAEDGSDISNRIVISVLNVPVESIELSYPEGEIKVGDSPIQIIAKITPENATDPRLVWEISEPEKGLLEESGGLEAYITPLSHGDVIISAHLEDNEDIAHFKSIRILPEIPVRELFLNPERMVVTTDDEQVYFEPSIFPDYSTVTDLKWSSSDPSTAEINEDTGVITIYEPGETIITATTTDGTELEAQAILIVTQTSIINSLFADDDYTLVDVYDMGGKIILQKVESSSNELKRLKSGFYIFRQGNISKKVFIR